MVSGAAVRDTASGRAAVRGSTVRAVCEDDDRIPAHPDQAQCVRRDPADLVRPHGERRTLHRPRPALLRTVREELRQAAEAAGAHTAHGLVLVEPVQRRIDIRPVPRRVGRPEEFEAGADTPQMPLDELSQTLRDVARHGSRPIHCRDVTRARRPARAACAR